MEPEGELFVSDWIRRQTEGARLSPKATRFLTDIVVEALDSRLAEPEARFALSSFPTSSRLGSSEASAMLDRSPLEYVVRDLVTPIGPIVANEQVLLADLLVAINLKWCSVWPFCRKPGGSLDLSQAFQPVR
ncbi:MAG TPA: hypothetical protein VEZ14_11910 [Dehalococcoidia bacterium]|nr:hypothetical protein [Dehalococcoidia bacterium]